MIALLLAATSKIGVDVSSAVDESTWKCLRSPGGQGPVEFAVVRVYRSTGTVDPSGAATIKAARAAGIQSVDGYVFPCVTCAASPGAQVRAAVDALDAAGATIGMLWLDIERYEWSTNFTANAAFVTAMVDECHALSLSCGIYGGKNSWVAIFGSASAYTYPATQGLPLWYAHYDNSPSFSDWTAYGGWSAPSIKQYLGDETSCGASIDYNWYPDSLAEQHASARQLQDEPFYDLHCPLGHSERAPCGLVAFVAQCTVSFFNFVIALVTVGHRLYQASCTAKRVDEAASASAGGSSWRKRLVLVVGTGALACVYYFAGLERPWAAIPLVAPAAARAACQIVGAAWVVVCMLVFVAVHLDLGASWSAVPERLEEHALVTSGVYRYSRHPMYADFLWSVPGLALALLCWTIPLAWLVLMLSITLTRLPQEEQILEAEFGDAYRAYQRTVPPLGPGTQFLTSWYAAGTRWRRWTTREGAAERLGA